MERLYQSLHVWEPANDDSVKEDGNEMGRHGQDVYHQFCSAGNEYQLFQQIARVAEGLEFEYCCHGICASVPVSKPVVAIFDTYPSGWMKADAAANRDGRIVQCDSAP
jgi:LuxR family transcriptional regulator, quorum-sensing system regulator SolR